MPKPLQRIFAAISSVVLIAGISLFFSTGKTVEGEASVLNIPTVAEELTVSSTWEAQVFSGTEQPVFSFEVDAGGAPFTLRFATFKVSSMGYDLMELRGKDHWGVYVLDGRGEIDYSKKVGEAIQVEFNEEGEGTIRLKFFEEPSSGLSSTEPLHLSIVAKPIRLSNTESYFKMETSEDSWAWAAGADLGAWALVENKFGIDSIRFL